MVDIYNKVTRRVLCPFFTEKHVQWKQTNTYGIVFSL